VTDREIEALRIPEPYEVKPWPRYSDIRIAPAPAGGAVGLPGIHLREVKQFFDGPASTVTPKDLRDLGKLIRTRGRG
jgi:hypothetical protein